MILFVALLSRQDWQKTWESLSSLPPWILPLVAGMYFSALLLRSFRWSRLLVAQGVQVPFGEVVKTVITGAFASNFFPSTIGGDTFRIIMPDTLRGELDFERSISRYGPLHQHYGYADFCAVHLFSIHAGRRRRRGGLHRSHRGGYAAVQLTAASWTVATVGGVSTASYPKVTFTFTGALTTNATIYGYSVIQRTSGKLVFVEKAGTPFTPANNGDTFDVTLTITAA